MTVWQHIVDCLNSTGSCALVTVTQVSGSTPREAGARMVVRPDMAFFGTIGGGTLEFEAIRKASEAARIGEPAFLQQSVSLGPDLGQCCGGRAKIAIEVLTADALPAAEHLASVEAGTRTFGTYAEFSDGRVSDRQVLEQVPEDPFALEEENGFLKSVTERFGDARQPLFLFGAGHVSKALILALAPLPFSITWIDSRADQFPAAVPANVVKVCPKDPAAVLDDAPDAAFVLVMTHSHALDEEIMARALLGQRFGYCGVIGSKTKRARFIKRLKARGIDEGLVSSMVCPVGKTTIKSKHPAAISAGIVVDLLERVEAGRQLAASTPEILQKATRGQ